MFHRLSRLITVFLLLSLTYLLPARADYSGWVPNPDISPQQVVKLVIESLQQNNEDDTGIEVVYRFASPNNKSSTGPLPRFTQMIKRGFPDMLNHAGARYLPMEVGETVAVQAVWIQTYQGYEVGYAFKLGKQSGGDYDGAWMTDAVLPLGKNEGV